MDSDDCLCEDHITFVLRGNAELWVANFNKTSTLSHWLGGTRNTIHRVEADFYISLDQLTCVENADWICLALPYLILIINKKIEEVFLIFCQMNSCRNSFQYLDFLFPVCEYASLMFSFN